MEEKRIEVTENEELLKEEVDIYWKQKNTKCQKKSLMQLVLGIRV